MNQPIDNRLSRLATGLLALLVCLIPFHAVLTVWASTIVGHYSLLRLWPELVLLILTGLALVLLARNPVRRRQFITDKLVWLLLGWAAVLLIWGGVAYAMHTVSRSALGQGLVIDGRLVASFLVAWVLAPSIKQAIYRSWRWLLIPAVAVVIFGLLQTYILPADVLKHVGYGPTTIAAVETIDQKAAYPRLQSTLRGANPLGAYLVIILTASLVGLIINKRARLGLLGLFLGSAIVLVYTYSRSAYIGTAVAVAAALWWSVRSQRWRRFIILGSVSVIIIAGIATITLRHNNRFQNMFFHTSATSRSAVSSNQVRGSALEAGITDVIHQPLGRGPGTAGPASMHNKLGPTRIAENFFLQIGQETGWLGLALFLAINGLIAGRLWQRRQQPLARVLLASWLGLVLINCLSHAWSDDTLAVVWWTLAGLVLGSAILPVESQNQDV